MTITNRSNHDIKCVVDGEVFFLRMGDTMQLQHPIFIEIKHCNDSYVCNGEENSKILKILHALDDPFKTKKEYHICINAIFDTSKCAESTVLAIDYCSVFADITSQVFYDYFVLNDGHRQLLPDSVDVTGKDRLCQSFSKHYSKYVRWDAIWNIFIEPVLLELIGYAVIYLLCSLWIGTKAWGIVVALLCLNILVEVGIFAAKIKKRQTDQFQSLLLSQSIMDICYSIAE